ncbi:MAG: DUF3024 domain-containing protein [Desulfuromusa sp.]|nr:DUF3024 domain-containing protein [Desulfuromusa sp.]
MAFSETELKRIDKLVGEYLRNLVPLHVRHQLQYVYRIENQNVILCEERPRYDKPDEWSSMDFAKLRYIQRHNHWNLYWKRASGKWELYAPKGEAKQLATIMRVIDQDNYGCFFG